MPFSTGEKVTATKLNLELRAGTLVARGNRASSSTGSTSTTDVGVLRIDSVALTAGRAYLVGYTSHINDTNASNDGTANVRVRFSTSGAATTASTVLPGSQLFTREATEGGLHRTILVPGADATYSFMLVFNRSSGTGTITLFADGSRNTDLFVEDCGVDPGDTGVDI